MTSLSRPPSKIVDEEAPPLARVSTPPLLTPNSPARSSIDGTVIDGEHDHHQPHSPLSKSKVHETPRSESQSTLAHSEQPHHIDEKTGRDEAFLVRWEGPDDPENPFVSFFLLPLSSIDVHITPYLFHFLSVELESIRTLVADHISRYSCFECHLCKLIAKRRRPANGKVLWFQY